MPFQDAFETHSNPTTQTSSGGGLRHLQDETRPSANVNKTHGWSNHETQTQIAIVCEEKFVIFPYSSWILDGIYIHFAFMWPSVYVSLIQSIKAHYTCYNRPSILHKQVTNDIQCMNVQMTFILKDSTTVSKKVFFFSILKWLYIYKT